MIKVQVFADLHLTNNEIIDGPVMKKLAAFVAPGATLVFAGDTFDTFKVGVSNDSFYSWLGSIDNEVYIVTGNHDFEGGVCALNLIRHFSDNIHIIRDYEWVDIHPLHRFHFCNYFRRQAIENVELAPRKLNTLFSHCDINNIEQIPSIFKGFNQIFNGHIHDMADYVISGRDEFHNVGSFRQVKSNETQKRRFMQIDIDDNGKFAVESIYFDSPVSVIRADVSTYMESISGMENGGILTVSVSNSVEKEQILQKIPENIIVKFEMIGKTKADVDINIDQIKSDSAELDYLSVFSEYLSDFISQYKVSCDKETMTRLFAESVSGSEGSKISNHSVKFLSIRGKNFKLFPEFSFDLGDFSGITSIIGENLDEPKEDGAPSSNESGKSNIIGAFLYALIGTESGVTPLRWGEKSGQVELDMGIDGDMITIKRIFSESKNDVSVTINGSPFAGNETNTVSMEMFFERYNIKAALQFLFLTNTGFAKYFFSAKTTERYNLFQTIFPAISRVEDIISNVKDKMESVRGQVDAKNSVVVMTRNFRSTYFSDAKKLRESFRISYYALKEEFDTATSDYEIAKAAFGNKKKPNENINELIGVKEKLKYINPKYYPVFDLVSLDDLRAYNDAKSSLDITLSFASKIESVDNLKKKLEDTKSELDHNMTEFSKSDKDLNPKNFEKLESLKIKLEEMQKAYDGMKNIPSSEIDTKKELKTSLIDSAARNDSKISALRSEINSLEEYIEKAQDSGICSECGAPLSNPDIVKRKSGLLGEKSAELDKLSAERQLMQVSIEKFENDIQDMLRSNEIYVKTSNEIDRLNTEIATTENVFVSDRERINFRIEAAKKDLEFVQEQITKAQEFEKNVQDARSKLELAEQKIAPLLALGDYRDYEVSFVTMQNHKDEIKKYGGIQQYIDDLSMKINEYNEYVNLEREVSVKYDKVQSIVKRIKESADNRREQKAAVSRKNKDTKKSTMDALIELESIQKTFSDYETLYKILTSKKTLTFSKYFVGKFFNKLSGIFNSFLQILFTRDVRIELNGVDFLFYDGGTSAVQFKDFSLGARTKIEAALLFTINMIFRNVGVDSDLIFLDEYLDSGLDDSNQDRVLEMLKHFYGDRKVVIVSHKGLKDKADRTVTIRRSNGQSEVVL